MRLFRRALARGHKAKYLSLFAVILIVVGILSVSFWPHSASHTHEGGVLLTGHKQQTPLSDTTPTPASTLSTIKTNSCSENATGQLLLVSISKRHLWACQGASQVYDSPVVTGMENIAADLTPTGTYHIYSKQTNLYLKGSDSTGSWNDYVSYWMPWLSNQYGVYGFHDATWRADNDFGNIDPYSSNASHGCVELPLATAKWVYDWSVIGTTVSIVS
jgi:hypothetical protein